MKYEQEIVFFNKAFEQYKNDLVSSKTLHAFLGIHLGVCPWQYLNIYVVLIWSLRINRCWCG